MAKDNRRNVPCTADISEQEEIRQPDSEYIQYIPEIDSGDTFLDQDKKPIRKKFILIFHKSTRTVRATAGVMGVLLFVWLISDTIFPYSSVGQKLHDLCWPPSVYLDTVPEGAGVFINGEDTEKKTPLRMAKLTPGRYDITFKLDGFADIEDVIDVSERNERIVLKKAFSRMVTIQSHPKDALVIINNRSMNKRTPCDLKWYVDKPLQLQLDLDGYPRLTDFEIDFTSGWSRIKDTRVWTFSTDDSDVVGYRIEGKFYKMVRFYSMPPDGSVIIDGDHSDVKKTDMPILLTVGSHRVEIHPPPSHAVFQPIRFDLYVDHTTPDRISNELVRTATVKAIGSSGRDIGASIISFQLLRPLEDTEIVSKDRSTPFRVDLPYFDARLSLGTPGYRDTTVFLEKNVVDFTVLMQKKSGSGGIDPELVDLFDLPETPVSQRTKDIDQQTSEGQALPELNQELLDLMEIEVKPSDFLPTEPAKGSTIPQSHRSIEKVEIKISVSDSVTRYPIENVEIEARQADGSTSYRHIGTTNGEGVITYRILQGTYDFRFRKSGWKPLIHPTHDVSPGNSLDLHVHMVKNHP